MACDRNLKSSNQFNTTQSWDYQLYASVFIIIIALGIFIGSLIKKYNRKSEYMSINNSDSSSSSSDNESLIQTKKEIERVINI